jgi:hypothetical protein
MTKITAGAINIYLGFSDETLPAAPVPEGSLYIFLDKPQIWIARSSVWSFLMPLNLSLSVPYGLNTDSVLIPAADGGTASRQVVAIGSTISGQPVSGIETALEQLIELNTAQLAELRVNNVLLQGLNTYPVSDDLDVLRAAVLDTTETLTR